MTTRVVHRVRCRKKDDKSIWVDVKVVDAITVIAPNGTEMLLWTRAKDADPFIVDKTGGNNGKGSADNCTRVSHMELVSGSEDPKQKFYIEVLDAIAFKPPKKFESDQSGAGLEDNEKRGGLPKSATFGTGPYALFVPESAATKFIVDNVGLGLGEGSSNGASRSGHINLVTEKGNTDEKTDESDSIPPKKLTWCATVKPDAVNFKVPGGNICLIIPKGLQEEVDTTKMTKDPITGDPCPPDNTDPNHYIKFPGDNSDADKPTIGCNIHIPRRTDGDKPIDQGPLWWIEKVASGFRPWFYFADINTPKAFSFFGAPGRLGSWAWRGFVLWNYYPVIWILSRNNPLIPMGQFGSPSLDLCARIGDWDFSFPPVPSAPFLAPPRPFTSNESTPFGPFGILQMTHPPLGAPPAGVPYGVVAPGSDIFDGRPNIWQLTGLQQPPRLDPTKAWDPFLNPYTPPSAKDAEDAAKKFKVNWNTVAQGHNTFIEGYVPGGGVSNGAPSYSQPPGWAWAVQWYDGFLGHGNPGGDFRASFQNGIPPGVATQFLPLEIYAPATSWTLDIDQLRPDWWDCTHLELYANPLNAFLPLVLPPFLWSNDPWTGSNHPSHPNPPSGP